MRLIAEPALRTPRTKEHHSLGSLVLILSHGSSGHHPSGLVRLALRHLVLCLPGRLTRRSEPPHPLAGHVVSKGLGAGLATIALAD